MCFVSAAKLNLRTWHLQIDEAGTDEQKVSKALASIEDQPFSDFLRQLAKALASFDWRTSAAPNISEAERKEKLIYRGGSGYREIRTALLRHVEQQTGVVADAAKRVREIAK